MDHIDWLDTSYSRMLEELEELSHEVLLEVDEEFLKRMGLSSQGEFMKGDQLLSRFFHVVQRSDKMILFNDDFAVWIVPSSESESATYVWIAQLRNLCNGFELGFVARDQYNSSKLVLRLLERVLREIEENEELIKCYERGG